jgi:hypothetical protein
MIQVYKEAFKTRATSLRARRVADQPLKGSKSLKTFKISLTFRLDKL